MSPLPRDDVRVRHDEVAPDDEAGAVLDLVARLPLDPDHRVADPARRPPARGASHRRGPDVAGPCPSG